MVAKKTPTPAWGEASKAETKPADDLEIPEFLRRDSEPQQMDIEDFTKEPETAPADGGASITTQHQNIAEPEPLHDPETGELAPEPEPEPTATGGDGRPLSRDDNQPRPATVNDSVAGTVSGQQLFAFIERYERLQEEKDTLAEDQREVLAEAKSIGFDVPTIRRLIQLRKLDAAARQEREALLDLYKAAIGME